VSNKYAYRYRICLPHLRAEAVALPEGVRRFCQK